MKYVFRNRFYKFLAFLIDSIGRIVFLPFNIFKKKKPGNVGKILLIRLDHIGDLIYSTPIPQNLKAHYRGGKITFLVASWAKEIVINNPYVDEVICYEAPWFNRAKKKIFDFKSFFNLAKELRRHDYDLGFDLRGDIRHILLMLLGGVKFRVGYGITGGGFMLHRQAKYTEGAHAIGHNLDLLRSMGINVATYKPKVYPSQKDEFNIRTFFEKNNLTNKDFIVTIHPHAGYPANKWMDERFVESIDLLNHRYNTRTILVGSEKDKASNDKIIEKVKAPAINYAGKTSLGGLTALLERSTLFVGVNSGPSHLAASVGVPMVVLYSGANTMQDWAPRSDKAIVIQKEIACKDCEQLDCKDNICMDLITIDDLLDAVDKIFAGVKL